MSHVHHLREFILERLTAAAQEIFSEVEKNIIHYEEVIDHQRKLLESSWKPALQLHSTIDPGEFYSQNEEVLLAEQELCKQMCDSDIPQMEPESLQIKEEQDDRAIQEDHRVKQASTGSSISSAREQNYYNKQGSDRDATPDYNFPVDESSQLEESQVDVPEPTRDEHNVESYLGNVNENLENFFFFDNNHNTDLTCNKKHGNASSVKQKVSHTGERPFSCKICGKGFSCKSHFSNHTRTHTGERPFSCETCGKCFSRNSHLLRHMMIHTGEKPFSCETCGKCFSRNSHLLRHMGTHARENVFV